MLWADALDVGSAESWEVPAGEYAAWSYYRRRKAMQHVNEIPGTTLTDEALATFHGGGECKVTIDRNIDGSVRGVSTSGDCDNVSVTVVVQS
ncbi:hypothetical protein [Micrococcoides hystricis]|uniref:Uncharacterized protein n=1 Tax=Micrococcoides hystricis TaxID=1572761 RepID=A0ABV6P800_9MICC